MSGLMVYKGIVVNMLALVSYDASIGIALCSLTLEYQVKPVAGDTVVQSDDIMVDAAVGLLLDIYIAHPDTLVVGFLKTVEVERRILAHTSLNDLC